MTNDLQPADAWAWFLVALDPERPLRVRLIGDRRSVEVPAGWRAEGGLLTVRRRIPGSVSRWAVALGQIATVEQFGAPVDGPSASES